MKKFVLLLVAISSLTRAIAQTDTTFFNSVWEPCEKSQAAYYRLPVVPSGEGYLVCDFFISGAKQFEGLTLYADSDVYQGKATWFYENGMIEQTAEYENGIKQGEFINFDKQGNIITKGIYKDDSPFDGNFYQTSEYISQTTTYSNGELVSAESFEPTSASKAKISITVTDSELQNGEIVYYNQKGELLGKLDVLQNNPNEGIVVEYSYHPMSVLTIYEISGGTVKSPVKHFYSNGSLKKLIFFESDFNYPFKEVYFDNHGNAVDTLLVGEGYPQEGNKIDFFVSDESSVSDKIEKIAQYKNGQLDGSSKTFYPNGKLQLETNFSDGIEIGDKITYDSLGNTLYTLSFSDGMPWTGTYKETEDILTYTDGIITGQKRFYSNGKPMIILSDGQETAYDTAGNVLALLQYQNGEPYEGNKVSIYYDQIYSEDIYSLGVKIKTNSYGEGILSYTTEYNSEGIQTKDIYYYTSGKIKKEVSYSSEGMETGNKYFDISGKPMGVLSLDYYGYKTGDYFEFDGDQIQSHILYDNENAIRTWTYSNGELVSDIRRDGKSNFYDKTNNKTYVCTYKDGEPLNGTKFEYDPEYDGITQISSFKNGVLDGEFTDFTFVYADESYSEGILIPEYVYQYKNGLKEGPAKQFFRDKLIKTMNYSNDILEGEYNTYDLQGNLLSTVYYKEDYPYQGDVVDYDYSYEQLLSVNSYTDGNMNGEQKYYEDGNIKRIETYENGVKLKEVFYLMGFAYELTFLNSEPFEGKKIDSYSYTISEYIEGAPVSIKTYTSDEYMTLKSTETFQGESSTKTIYFENGQIKEVSVKEGSIRQGKTTFYNSEGKEIASGIFESGMPASGAFAYYSINNETDYLILQIDNNTFRATEYIAGNRNREFNYSLSENSNSPISDEIQKFISSVQLMFDSYTYDDSNDLYY
jgi:antitoxin component YwqK of YwqJK toxin-antitoxin module